MGVKRRILRRKLDEEERLRHRAPVNSRFYFTRQSAREKRDKDRMGWYRGGCKD